MPSGQSHDRITIATSVLSYPVWWLFSPTHNYGEYAAGVAAYIFSGFYLSGDLDTHSIAMKRWGKLRFIWYPYQKLVPHRSWISHGLGIGPILRVIYFAIVIWSMARSLLWFVNYWIAPVDRDTLLTKAIVLIATMAWSHPKIVEWSLGGLILGGVTHTLADCLVSGTKRLIKAR